MAYISFEPSGHFNATGYTGDGSTQSITGVGFQPDMNFVKSRAVQNWGCVDAIRGVGEAIHPNLTLAEGSAPDGLTAFNADGFSVGTDTTWNGSTVAYASYNWKAGTTTALSGGTITPTAQSINTTSGIAIIKYTGNDTAGATIPHGLGAVPKMIIIKNLISANNWVVYHEALGNTKFLELNTTAAAATATTAFNDTSPTSSVFSVGSSGGVNSGDKAMLAYCFAEKKGYSKFGSYTGNGYVDGAFVYTGFRPAFFMIKKTNATSDWYLWDNKRLGYNVANYSLSPNATFAKNTTVAVDLVSNGAKLRSLHTEQNGSGSTYIYAAFAEFPVVSSNDIPGTAR